MGIGNKIIGIFFVLTAIFALLLTTEGWGFAIEGISDILAIGIIIMGIFFIWKG